MSLFNLQKQIREINRNPVVRQRYIDDPKGSIANCDLSPDEAKALIVKDYATLYRMGVHGLLLRPFSIIFEVPEPDYLKMIRGEI